MKTWPNPVQWALLKKRVNPMKSVEQLTTLENTLATLTIEHKKILTELSVLEGLIQDESNFSTKVVPAFKNLKNFLLPDHHKREDSILYEWMLNQNSTVDHDIIDRIRLEHQNLEVLMENINKQVENISQASPAKAVRMLAHDLLDFIELYREHVELEEKFIFMIAKGLLSVKRW